MGPFLLQALLWQALNFVVCLALGIVLSVSLILLVIFRQDLAKFAQAGWEQLIKSCCLSLPFRLLALTVSILAPSS